MMLRFCKALLVALAACATGAQAAFVDVLDVPAQMSALAPKRLLNGAALAGKRVVAVGQRGHIVYSDDAGRTWKQATVPVSADLTAVHFPTATKGWAVGHAGVVLATSNGGASWVKQLDGRAAAKVMVDYYAQRPPQQASGNPEQAAKLVEDIKRFASEGADKPFLDVWFENETTGYIVGLFNLIFRTSDGGKSWIPLFDRTDNPKLLHFYAIRPVGDELYIAGEQGLVLKLDRQSDRFRAVVTPYDGTYFGITGKPSALLVFGLRGNAYRSSDGGASWVKVETGVPVGLAGATLLADGRIVLVSQAGHVIVSSDSGATFVPIKLDRPIPAGAVVAPDDKTLILAGPRGVAMQPLP